MESFMKEFEHLKIHLEDLKQATNSFGSKVIGVGGFGKVYEGEISHSRGRSLVAIKRLSRGFGQGVPEFLKEIMMLSRYSHENLITLLGYCDEDGEKILVYEHASNGSLDRHLSSNVLTWPQRLKICLDAAKGLEYLHDHRGTQQIILHRDIKSANILLDDNWNAKLSDMGLSRVGPANQQHSVLVTNIVGTLGYFDPLYLETYMLSKESDIYSFGVVLFEVLCGKLCFKCTNDRLEIFVPLWKQSYIDKNLDKIIFKDLRPSMDPTSFETFSEIAFQCLHYSREQRPTASLLVEKLEIALKCQERHDMKLTNVVGKYSKGEEVFFNIGKTNREGATRKDAEGNGGNAVIAPKKADAASKTETESELVHFDGTKISLSSHNETKDSEENDYDDVDYTNKPLPTVEDLQTNGEPYPGMLSFEDRGNGSGGQFWQNEDNRDDEYDEYFHGPKKKRRLTVNQVRILEQSFESDKKLEPERKIQLAKELGLQPRHVAIWFQVRRASWKHKQLQKDYAVLQESYNKLKANYETTSG